MEKKGIEKQDILLLLEKKLKKDFEKVLWISGENKTYFSRNQDELRIPEKVKKTDIYVETKLNPDEVVKTSKALLAEFGYSSYKLKITTE